MSRQEEIQKLINLREEAEKKGVKLIDKEKRKGAEGLNIGFLHPKFTMGVLTEFCEKG